MSNAPSVDPARIEEFYRELTEMQVDLDADPLSLGPKRINQKTSECRAFLSRTERIFLEVSQDLHWYKREHRRALADFELAVQDLMTNDPETRSGRNITDRQAIASTKLRPDRERISTLQFGVEDLEAVMSVVKVKRNDLKDIASRLRDQLKICQEEIGLGGRWGTRTRVSTAKIPDSAGSSVDKFLDDVMGKFPDSQDEEPESEVEEPEKAVEPTLEVGPTSDEVAIPEGLLEDAPQSVARLPAEMTTSGVSDADMDAALDEMDSHLPVAVHVMSPVSDSILDEILDTF